ncbi:unnamed protein product [Sympodiomycopsis kandeliae]
MPLSLDTIIYAASKTVLHPFSLLGYVLYKSLDAKQRSFHLVPYSKDGYIKAAYAILALYLSSWLKHRWRNGWVAPKKLNSQTWKNEIVLITGGAAGIAKVMTEKLAAKGAKVAAVDIASFQPTHGNIKSYQCDISSYDGLAQVKEQIRIDFGGDVTMVCNVAGLNNKSLILDLTEAQVSKMIDVNLKSHFWTAMLFLPAMIKAKRGHFLSVASTMAFAGICHQSDYAATKHALVGMHESLYYELTKMYKTPMVRTTLGVIGHTKTELFKDFDVGPLGRFMAAPMPIEFVADKLIEPLQAQESKMVILPAASSTAPGLKNLPYILRDVMQWLSGADGSYPSRPTKSQLGH